MDQVLCVTPTEVDVERDVDLCISESEKLFCVWLKQQQTQGTKHLIEVSWGGTASFYCANYTSQCFNESPDQQQKREKRQQSQHSAFTDDHHLLGNSLAFFEKLFAREKKLH